jgi:1-acyl-sn-glycerol-3-phosphate acyltransferase
MAEELKQKPAFTHLVVPIARAVAWVLFTFLGPFRRYYHDRIPAKGGLLILSNHLADVDPIAVQLGCKRPIYFMAKSELFEMRIVGRILKAFKAFPVKRGEADRTAIKRAVTLLREGEAVCVFPEGELSETGELLPLKPGVALIVRMAQAPVICCRLDGTNRILPYGSLIPRPSFHLVKVTWSEPKLFPKEAETEEILKWAENQLRTLALLEDRRLP